MYFLSTFDIFLSYCRIFRYKFSSILSIEDYFKLLILVYSLFQLLSVDLLSYFPSFFSFFFFICFIKHHTWSDGIVFVIVSIFVVTYFAYLFDSELWWLVPIILFRLGYGLLLRALGIKINKPLIHF
jgi:hypothetical protein